MELLLREKPFAFGASAPVMHIIREYVQKGPESQMVAWNCPVDRHLLYQVMNDYRLNGIQQTHIRKDIIPLLSPLTPLCWSLLPFVLTIRLLDVPPPGVPGGLISRSTVPMPGRASERAGRAFGASIPGRSSNSTMLYVLCALVFIHPCLLAAVWFSFRV